MNYQDQRVLNLLKKIKIVSATNLVLSVKDDGLKGIVSKINERREKRLKQKSNNTSIVKCKISDFVNINSNEPIIDVIIDCKLDYENIKKMLLEISDGNNIKFNILLYSKASKSIDNIEKKISYYEMRDLFSDRAFIFITKNVFDSKDFFYCFNLKYSQNLKEEISRILNEPTGLKLLANYDNANSVSVKCSTFYDFKGSNYYSGGAERYLIDLYNIFKDKKINLDIYQNAEKPFFRKYNNINVIGMCLKNQPLNLDNKYNDYQSKHYLNLTNGKTQLHIYSAFFECYPNCGSPSIGISHGVGWDSEFNVDSGPIDFWNNKLSIIESAKKCDYLVSVDTNTANWFQTIDYNIGCRKFYVIPNYVDVNEFYPRKDYLKKRDKIIIVYPRRLYKPRGLYIALNAAEKLLSKYSNIEFHFVGKGFKKELDDIDKVIKKYPNRVFCYSKSPFEMHEIYKNADISLIPTLYSEGTSLSCLEAMACGNLVISTRIGGLSDLILNSYNGYLIEPNEKALFETLDYVIRHYDDQLKIKENAVEVAKCFNKKIWVDKWNKVIDNFNLNKTSKNIGLIEFYVKDIENISKDIFDLIKDSLYNGNLVYIRSKKKLKNDYISGNLIQLIDFDDEIVNTSDKLYVEKSVKKHVKRTEKMEII